MNSEATIGVTLVICCAESYPLVTEVNNKSPQERGNPFLMIFLSLIMDLVTKIIN